MWLCHLNVCEQHFLTLPPQPLKKKKKKKKKKEKKIPHRNSCQISYEQSSDY